jgi:hypothetical protein
MDVASKKQWRLGAGAEGAKHVKYLRDFSRFIPKSSARKIF